MNNPKNTNERRTQQRLPFQVKYGVVPLPESSKFGRIIDLSKGGLAFRYFDNKAIAAELFELDILFEDDNFYLEKLSCKIIADHAVPNGVAATPSNMRRCSVEFGQLIPHQISQLESFIHDNTKGETYINLYKRKTARLRLARLELNKNFFLT